MRSSVLILGVLVYLSQLYITSVISFPPRSDSGPPSKRGKTSSEPRCSLLFSEIMLGSSPDLKPFIELKSICLQKPGPAPANALAGYKLVGLKLNPVSLVMLVDFDLFPFSLTKRFIVIGAPNVDKVDIPLSSGRVQSIFSKSLTGSMFPNLLDGMYTFMILHNIPTLISRSVQLIISAEGKALPKILSSLEVSALQESAIDMIIPSSSNTQNQFILSTWNSKSKYNHPSVLENLVDFMRSPDRGLSMCSSSYSGFDASAFKLKIQSPGVSNFCEDPVIVVAPTEKEVTVPQCTDTQPTRFPIHNISPEKLQNLKSTEFKASWITKCSQYFPPTQKLLLSSNIQSWIQFDDVEGSCKFSCKICQFYYSIGFRPDVKRKPNLVKTSYFSKNIYDNSDQLKTHLQNDIHVEATNFWSSLKNDESLSHTDCIIKQYENREMRIFNATMNLIQFTYSELKVGIAFHKHEDLMRSLVKMGVRVRWHHHTSVAARNIAEVISNDLHSKLLNYLVQQQVPFSIIADSSTVRNQALLIVFIQTLEENHPVSHFYSLMHLTKGETGAAIAATLANQVKDDDTIVQGFENYFKDHLASIITDSAANMVGSKNSFKTHLFEYVHRTVPNIICMAHRLDSAINFGLKPKPELVKDLKPDKNADDKVQWDYQYYFSNFEKSLNEFYSFYVSRGHKKWQHFLETVEMLGQIPKTLKYFFDVRWSESHFNALDSLRHNYKALLEDLMLVINDSNFDTQSKNIARKLNERLTDKSYAFVLHEFLDMLTVFKHASKLFQEDSSNLVGKDEIVNNILTSLNELTQKPGKYITVFLQQCSCKGISADTECTPSNFDKSDVSLFGVPLKYNYDVQIKMAVSRNILYGNLIDGVKKYFDMAFLNQFEVLNPRSFVSREYVESNNVVSVSELYRTNALDAEKSPQQLLLDVCEFFNPKDQLCQQFPNDWFQVAKCLILDKGLNTLISEKPTTFWSFALTQCKNAWTDATMKTFKKIMVTPYSSAEAERGFSVINNIKTKSRSAMDKFTLDSLTRIQINGPEVDELDVYELTIAFLKKYCTADDKDFKGGRPALEEKRQSYFQKSKIYSINNPI